MLSYGKRLKKDFYMHDIIETAKKLLGKYIVHIVDGKANVLEITETEAYTGTEDKACHGYGGKRTKKNMVMYRSGGYAYIFSLYGHAMFNVVTGAENEPTAVLIRKCRPVDGLNDMAERRYGKDYKSLGKTKLREFTNGPGKACQALGISMKHNGTNLLSDELFIASPLAPKSFKISEGKRINLGRSVGEAADYPYRFFISKD